MPEQQAYINGFVKRASEYGYSEAQAVELVKQAAPAYERPDKLTEEELKNMSYSDLQDYIAPKEGEGALAHIKRNKMKYLGGLLGGIATYNGSQTSGNNGLANLFAASIGATGGAGLGYVPDKILNAFSKHSVKAEANKNIAQLKKHIINQAKLNSPVSRNLHSLSFD